MRWNHVVAALAVLACLSMASSALAGNGCGDGTCDPGEDCANCTDDCGCDDGLFCNGLESCNSGTCEAVSACPPFIDGCVTRNDSCDEDNDQCIDFADDSLCDDGLFCNGLESCNQQTGGCQAVSACPPFIDGCVIRNASCDEDNDKCLDVVDNSFCEDGLFCDLGNGRCLDTEP